MRHVFLILLMVAPAANAATWMQIVQPDSKGSALYVDMADIARVDDLRTARFKRVYTSDRVIPKEYEGTSRKVRGFRSEMSLRYFNCADRTVALSQSILHNADDQVVGSLDIGRTVLDFRGAPPESLNGKMLDVVCNWKFPDESAGQPAPPLVSNDEPRTDGKQEVGEPPAFYPPDSVRREAEGSVIVQACVGPDGKLLRDPIVTTTSGFPDLDAAAIKVAKATRYKAAMENGDPLPESCIKFKVKFKLNDR